MPGATLNHIPGMRNATSVPVLRAETLSERDFLNMHVSHSRPCVIQGAVRHWAATEKWRSSLYLKARAGHHSVYYHPHEYHLSNARMEAGRTEMPFAEAVERLQARETDMAIVATAAPVELQADLGAVSFLTKAERAFSYPPARYFFYRNAGTTWHYHPFDETLMCQIVGSKRIGLLNVNTPASSTVRDLFLREDYYDSPAAFDGLTGQDLPWFDASLEEGDVLYIPPLWWHGIVPLHDSFGATATVTWRSPLHVDANAIRLMASGQLDLVGGPDSAHLPHLLDVARKTGLEKELQIGWARQFTSVMA